MNTTTTRKAALKPFSEVVFSSGNKIIAQCYKETISSDIYKDSLIQGTIVKIISSYDSSYQAFGIIAKINNTSLDSIHRPQALGLSPNELNELQPQLYELLKKELEIYLFAYSDKNYQIIDYPPQKPMTVHDFVYLTSQDEVFELTKDLSNLINVLKKNQIPCDILINLIFKGYLMRNKDREYLVKIGQDLSFALQEEPDSLISILKRISELQKA